MGMINLMNVVEFVANEWEAKCIPFLQAGDKLRGMVRTKLNTEQYVITAIVGNSFHKFYKYESELTKVS